MISNIRTELVKFDKLDRLGKKLTHLFRRSNSFGSFVSYTPDMCVCSNPWISKMDSWDYYLCIDNLLMKENHFVTAGCNSLPDTCRMTLVGSTKKNSWKGWWGDKLGKCIGIKTL